MSQKFNNWIELGNQQLNKGNYSAALVYFDKVINQNSENTEAWKGLNAAIINLNEEKDIVCASSYVIAIILYERGCWLAEKENYLEAIKFYDQALDVKSDFEEIKISRKKALKKLGTPLLSYVLQRGPSPKLSSSLTVSSEVERLYQKGMQELDKGLELLKTKVYEQDIQSLEKNLDAKKYFESAGHYFNKIITIDPENTDAWYAKSNSLQNLGYIQEAITSLKHALEINHGYTLEDLIDEEEIYHLSEIRDNPYIYNVRGDALRKLGFYEEAINNCNKVIHHRKRNSSQKDDYDLYKAYLSRGTSLRKCERYSEALNDYEQAIVIRPDSYFAHCGHANILRKLECYEKAIKSYEQAILIEGNSILAYNGLGNVYKDLGHYKKALFQYNKAVWLQPKNYLTYNNRGQVLRQLGLLNEAICDFNKSLELSRQQNWRAWVNLGWTYFQDLKQYQEASRVWDNGLKELERLQQLKPNPEYQRGRGELYWCKGKANHRYGCLQHKPYSFWFEAYNNFEKAIKLFEYELLPERQLEVWEDLIKVSQYIIPKEEIQELLQKATDLLRRLQEERSAKERIRLERKFAGFDEIGVDILAIQGKGKAALEVAEKRKNTCLSWILEESQDLASSSPKYDEIQKLLDTKTSAIYWHISPSALTTFILNNNDMPIVWTLEPDPNILKLAQISDLQEKEKQKNHLLKRTIIPQNTKRLNQFEEWTKRWKSNYEENCEKSKDSKNIFNNTWQEKIPKELKNLAKILQIEEIERKLQENIDKLVIIAHHDLHLLPLEALFSKEINIIRLPSAKIGLYLKENNIEPKNPPSLFSIEHPQTTQPLLYAEIESAIIANLYKEAKLVRIKEDKATKAKLLEILQHESSDIFHFTGHAEHNINSPLKSALELANHERLSMKELFKNLNHRYYLVCLSACETGLTSNSNIIDEFVGLASAFLTRGSNYIISTLWTVNEISSALIMIEFYRLLKAGNTPPEALKIAKYWLRDITYAKLAKWYEERAKEIENDDLGCCENLESAAENMKKVEKSNKKGVHPYSHQYHWAGFTITGKIPN